MKNGLSALKYVRNNKKQVWVMIIALSLTFMTMYVVGFLFMTTRESFRVICMEWPKKVACIDLGPETMGVKREDYASDEAYGLAVEEAREELVRRLKEREGIRDAVFTQTCFASYSGIFGGLGWNFPLLTKEQVPEFLEHVGAELIEGRMPEGDGEILVEEKILKNKKMKIGGYFNEEGFGKTFKVVGVLSSDYMTCVGTPMGYSNSGWYIVVLCDEASADMTKVLGDIGITPGEQDIIYDCADFEELFRKQVEEQLDAALLVILVVVTVFLAISILAAYVSFLRSRVNEYCLYASIGFGRKEVYGMIMREVFLIFGISLLLGTFVTVAVMLAFGSFVLEPMGLVYRYLDPENLFRILTAFVVVVALLQVPISVTVNNVKTIDRIE